MLSGEAARIEGCGARRFMHNEWPNRAASRLVDAGGLEWHVQIFGSGPPLLLLHGTGASAHTWRDSAPLLAKHFRVIAPDLPGHGFTSAPDFAGFSLSGMAGSVRDLLSELDVSPAIAAGHSAGAAILIRMALNAQVAPRFIAAINGAILPVTGFPHWLFSPMARFLARNRWVPHLLATRAGSFGAVRRLIRDTSSELDETGVRLYQHLLQTPSHVAAALSMMANWDLATLARDVGRLRTPLKLLVGERDRAIPPAEAARVSALVRGARIFSLGNYGHLAHEEVPGIFSDVIVRLGIEAGVLTAGARETPGGLWWLHPHMQL